MSVAHVLHDLFAASARRVPERPAVVEATGDAITYAALDSLTLRVCNAIMAAGVQPGDRVGVLLPKSIDSVAVILGTLRAGAAYVPVDHSAPARRAAFIFSDCAARVVVTDHTLAPVLTAELASLGASTQVVALAEVGGGAGVAGWLGARGDAAAAHAVPAHLTPDTAAYILYTSGSTGNPKGVLISHRAALAFVHWCIATFDATETDRFSSHAPFHFDLSVFDLYYTFSRGASVVLIGEELGKDPAGLAELIERMRITVWYSTPSSLSLIVQYGRVERRDCSSLRIVCFAGEVFPIPRLRALMDRWPAPRYFNLYGPTETNVCTWHEVPRPLPASQTEALPIGRVCAHYRAMIADDGDPVAHGARGELLMSGPGVMTGYWNQPERNAAAFHVDAEGVRWYRTGDIVADDGTGVLTFFGRKDRMVKRRGYRIELGEIEHALARFPGVHGVATIARTDPDANVTIKAFLATGAGERPSLLALKKFCVDELPRYMTPDTFTFVDAIPQTSTAKTDYQALVALGSP